MVEDLERKLTEYIKTEFEKINIDIVKFSNTI